MKKLLLILITLAITVTAGFAQCRYRKNEVDKFTGNKTVRLKPVTAKASLIEFVKVHLGNIEGTRYLRLEWVTYSLYSINKGANLILLLENGEKVTLTANDYEIAKTSGKNWVINSYYYLGGNYDKLKESAITEYRIYTNQGYVEQKINKSRRAKLKAAFSCIE